jgi:N-acetylglucosaminyldiphosphoundecaprenol N-acetyl-beta-D-mannosaminyltransferase
MARRPMTPHTVDPGDWQSRWHELVKGVVRVQSMRGEQQLLAWLTRPGEPRILAFVNAHAMNAAAASLTFFNALISADLLLRDGTGMAILLRLLSQTPGLNLNGTDLIPRILRQYGAGKTIALFGTQDPYLSRALAIVSARVGPGVRCIGAGGFLETACYVRLAAAHRPAIIVLGMGMPRQEEVAVALRAAIGFPCLIICGGAIIDFLGNKTPRAPGWLRRAGFEWLFRLALEPKRLFKRYVIGNPLFIARALWLAAQTLRHERGAAA